MQHCPESPKCPEFFFSCQSLRVYGLQSIFWENYFGGYMIWHILLSLFRMLNNILDVKIITYLSMDCLVISMECVCIKQRSYFFVCLLFCFVGDAIAFYLSQTATKQLQYCSVIVTNKL